MFLNWQILQREMIYYEKIFVSLPNQYMFFFSLESNGKVIQPNKVDVRSTNVFLTQDEINYLSNKKSLRVGVNLPSFTPFDIVEEGQEHILYSGISSEVIAIISDILDIELEFYFFNSRNEAIAAILKNEIDLITSSNGYELQFGLILSDIYFPDRPILFRSSKVNDIKTVSVAHEYLDAEHLRAVFPHIEFLFYPSREEAIAAAVFGEVDAVINDLLSLNHSYNNHYIGDLKYQEVIQEVDSQGFAFSFEGNNTILKNIFNKVIASIDTNTLQLIVHRWNGGGITPPTLDELAYIKDHVVKKLNKDELSVVVMQHQAPFSYLDEFNNPQGILVELLNLFNIYTGVKINLIIEQDLENAFLLLKDGQVDLIVTNESKSRRQEFLISDIIFRNPFVYVTHKNVTLHDIESVVTTKNSIIKEAMDLSNYKTIQMEDYLSVLIKVISDKKSAAIMPISIANFYISQYFFDDLEVNGINYDLPNAKVAFAAANGNEELMSFVNGLLREIPKGQIEAIANMWRKNAVVVNNTWKDYKYTVYTLSISMAVILFLVIIYIILARKALKIERNLKNQNTEQLNFLQDIVDSIPHPIYFMSENFKIKVSNEAFKSIFSYQSSGSFNFMKRLGYAQYSKLIRRHEEVIQSNESSVEDYTLYIDNQKYVIYHWLRAYSDINGYTSGVIGGWLDISERAKLLDKIEDAKIEAESANSAKSLFLATMSHEIRTPMNVIIGALDLVINYDYNQDEKNKHLNIAYSSAKDLLSLIGDILDISKIEANELNIIPKDADFKDTINSIFNMFYGLAKQKNIRLIKNYDETIESFLIFDDLRLKQILLNVLSNAVKFTDEGSIQLKVVNLGVFNNHQEIKIVVKDTGIGIKQEEVKKLFKTFSQTSSSYNRGGTGLGLMISKNLCELMSGKMDLSSQADIGTTVSMIFKFPIVQNLTSLDKYPVEDKEEQFEKKRILLVDDHPSNRIILSKQIEQLGHEVLTACDGYDALSVLEKNKDINVIITDCHMPEMDGYELTKNIRTRFFSRNNLIILGLTANAQSDIKEKCLRVGMSDCLFKPLDIKELERFIHMKVINEDNKKQADHPNLVIDKDVLIYLMDAGVDLISVFDEFVKTTCLDLLKLYQVDTLEEKMELIHRIKSASNMLGFQSIIKICLSIESKYNLEDSDIENLQSEFNNVIVAMDDFLS